MEFIDTYEQFEKMPGLAIQLYSIGLIHLLFLIGIILGIVSLILIFTINKRRTKNKRTTKILSILTPILLTPLIISSTFYVFLTVYYFIHNFSNSYTKDKDFAIIIQIGYIIAIAIINIVIFNAVVILIKRKLLPYISALKLNIFYSIVLTISYAIFIYIFIVINNWVILDFPEIKIEVTYNLCKDSADSIGCKLQETNNTTDTIYTWCDGYFKTAKKLNLYPTENTENIKTIANAVPSEISTPSASAKYFRTKNGKNTPYDGSRLEAAYLCINPLRDGFWSKN